MTQHERAARVSESRLHTVKRLIVLVVVLWLLVSGKAYASPQRVEYDGDPVVARFHTVVIQAIAVTRHDSIQCDGALIMVRSERLAWNPEALALGYLKVDYDVYRNGVVEIQWPVSVFPVQRVMAFDVINAIVYETWYALDYRPNYHNANAQG